MACVRNEMHIDAPVGEVWDALRDWGALHERLAPGFAVDVRVEGEDRVVTMFTGSSVRERIIDVDDEHRRLAWTIVDGPYAHHSGSAQAVEDAGGGTCFIWISDVLPHEVAGPTRQYMDRGSRVIKATLEERS